MHFFNKKFHILENFTMYKKHRDGFEGRLYPIHFPKQKRKSGATFRNWIQKC